MNVRLNVGLDREKGGIMILFGNKSAIMIYFPFFNRQIVSVSWKGSGDIKLLRLDVIVKLIH